MPRQLIANKAAIATGHPLGAAAGLEIFEQGGNAIDAAVAAMLALSVVIPGSVGLGGYGGSAVIFRSPRKSPLTHGRGVADESGRSEFDSQPVLSIDFDSRAPLAYREGLVTGDKESNHYGPRSVTVPAVVAGLDLILKTYGTQSWSEVSQPAIRLAEEGFEFDSEHKRYLDRSAPHFDRESLACLFADGCIPNVGDRWRQPQLANLLTQLADDGPGVFYDGPIAQSIVRFLQDRGGLLAEDDFLSYRPRVLPPTQISYGDCELYTPPPPSGGITALAIMQTMDAICSAGNGASGRDFTELETGQSFHFLAEAMKRCWQDRQQYLGDPDFVAIPFEKLLSQSAATSRAAQITEGRPTLATTATDQSPHTGNVIAIDAEGNVISLTATQGWMYGSHLVVGDLGLVLNHGMSRFDYAPGHPNAPAPGKRMQHNMAPMLAMQSGQPAFAFGMPGGPKIVSVTAQVAMHAIAYGKTPAECIEAPRLHNEGTEPLQVSPHLPPVVADELERRGHSIQRKDDMGGPVNVLAVDPKIHKIDIASGEGTGAVAGF